MTEPLLAPEDVAQHCGLSRRAVYDAIRRGELPAMRLCSRLRIRTEDLDAWLDAASVALEVRHQPVAELRKPAPPPPATGSFRALMAADGSEETAA